MSETKEAEIAHIKSEVNSPKHRLLKLLFSGIKPLT